MFHALGDIFTERQQETLRAMWDRLLPDDDWTPGALGAGVPEYVLRALTTDYDADRASYTVGLDSLDALALSRHGQSFAELAGREQDVLLSAAEAGDTPRGDADQRFFELVRNHVLEGMFGDPAWGGNRGYAGWKLIGLDRPRLVWSQSAQRLEDMGKRGLGDPQERL